MDRGDILGGSCSYFQDKQAEDWGEKRMMYPPKMREVSHRVITDLSHGNLQRDEFCILDDQPSH